MGLRDDLETMQRHKDNGTLHEYLHGLPIPSEKQLGPEPRPLDPSANMSMNDPRWIAARGD